MTLPAAKEWGAVALFGETYDEEVRVIQVGGAWSRELCGGTHVSRSSQVGLISISGESSVGSGSRRIEALVGQDAFRFLATERALVARLSEALKSPREQLEARLEATIEELRVAKTKLASLFAAEMRGRIPQWLAASKVIGQVKLVSAVLGSLENADEIRSLAGDVLSQSGSDSVVVVTAVVSGKPVILVAVGESARSGGAKAGALVKLASEILGGGGGGKDDMAQGGGVNPEKLPEAIAAIEKAIA
jgi:alanyl-tRNA synthetase